MRRLLFLLVVLCLVVPSPASAGETDYDIPNGRFFTQTAGDSPGGYSVTNEGVPFWSTFKAYGGVAVLGYPVSRRFMWDGQPAQAFQKAVLHWRPDLNRVVFINVFDELAKAKKDGWLREVRLVPPPAPIPDEDKLDFPTIVKRRQALLDARPAMRDLYNDTDDPMTLYGLPVSAIEDLGTVQVVRLQRATFQIWKTDRPWAKAGAVVVANGGDVAKEAGLFPPAATAVEPPGGAPSGQLPSIEPLSGPAPAVTPFAGPTAAPARPATSPTAVPPTPLPPTQTPSPPVPPTATPKAAQGIIIAIDPGHGGSDNGASARFADGVVLKEKDVNLMVARKVADGLRAAGYAVVLTRDSDRDANRERRDYNADGKIDIKDDLQARIDIANSAKANLFFSIHHNGHDNAALNGLEVYQCSNRPFAAENKKLGTTFEGAMLAAVRAGGYPLTSRGVKDCFDAAVGKSYWVIGPIAEGRPRATNMPGIIGEAMFITNASDATALRDDRTLTAEANGYIATVRAYFGR